MTITELPAAWLPLGDAVAKATVILLLAGIASIVLRGASAALRHLVWTLALCSTLLMPLLSLALPKWQLPVLKISEPAPAVAVPTGTAAISGGSRVRAPQVGNLGETATAPMGRRSSSGNGNPAPSRDLAVGLSWQSALAALWLLGAAAIFSRILVGLAAVRLLSRRTQEITDAAWLPMARAVAREMGVTAKLRFLRSGRAAMPVAAGIFRPSVIMPSDADTWSENRLRVVLLHELAHVKRRDCLTHVLAQAACALYWFNPLAWLAVKKARSERERACDDLVLACGTRGSDYADQLLEMARSLRGDRYPALLGGASLAMAHRSQLEGRLIAILDPRVPRSGVSRGRAVAAVALACCAVAPLAAVQPWVSRIEAPPQSQRLEDGAAAAVVVHSHAAATVAPDVPGPGVADETIATVDTAARIADPNLAAPAPRPQPRPEPQPFPVVNGEDAVAAATAAAAAAGVTEAVIEAITQDAKTPAPTERVSKADPRMVAALTAALKDTDKEVRETALHALVQMRDPAIFEPLLQALKDASPEVREQAAFGLGQLRDRRATQQLVSVLKDEHASVREQAAFALGQLRDRAAVEALVIAIRDANKEVREQVAFALGQLRDPRAIEALTTALKDQDAEVRRQAAFALGQLAR